MIEVIGRHDTDTPETIAVLEPGASLTLYSHATSWTTAIVLHCPLDEEVPAPIFHVPVPELLDEPAAPKPRRGLTHLFKQQEHAVQDHPLGDPVRWLRGLMYDDPTDMWMWSTDSVKSGGVTPLGLVTSEQVFVTLLLRRLPDIASTDDAASE